MKISFVLLLGAAVSLALPQPSSLARDGTVRASLEMPDLEKRRGGGRGGGFSGGGGGGRSGSSGGRGGSRPASTRLSPPTSPPRKQLTKPRPSSNQGGITKSGSGPQPAYGRSNSYYAGGAHTPYTAGKKSPGGLSPFLLPATAMAFFPGIWLYGIYAYPYRDPYRFVNQTTNQNETIPVVCLCQEYSVCGCDKNHHSGYFKDLFNGPVPHDTDKVQVADVNGTRKVVINGTLPNGTTRSDPDASGSPATIAQASGYWVMAAVVMGAVWLL